MSQRILSVSRLTFAFAALVVLTAVTIGVAFLELGAWHTSVGLAIAAVKAVVVVVVFMEVFSGERSYALAMGAGLFWLAILLSLTLADYLTRAWISF